MGGYDVAQQFPKANIGNVQIGGTSGDIGLASLLYNAIKSGINIADPSNVHAQYGQFAAPESIALNMQGAKGLSDADLALYNQIIGGQTQQSELDRFKTAWDMANYGMPSEQVNWTTTARPDYEKNLREYQTWNQGPWSSDPSITSKITSGFGHAPGYMLAGGGLAGMLGEPTYEDDNHRVPLKDGSWKPPLEDENILEGTWKNMGPWEKFLWGIGLLPFEKGGRVPDEDARLLNQLPTQELQIGPYIPELGHKEGFEDNYIEFDDGTVYFKDTGEFYDQEGKQVTSPSAGAKPVGEILEAAEGGRVGLAGGGLPAALRLIMQKYGKDVVKLAKDVKPSKKWDTQKAIQAFKDRNPEFKAEGGRVPMWMGGGFKAGKGLLRLLMRHLSKEGTTGLKGSDLLKLTNTKQYHNMLNRPEGIPTLAKEMIEKYSKDMKVERINSVKQALDMAKKMKTAKDKTLAMDKITEGMTKKYVGEGMDEGMVRNLIDMFIKAKYPDYSKVKAIKDLPNVTSQGILELENILKNLATKGRKLNATGGLAKMLGE